MKIHSPTKATLLKAGLVVFAICAGATTMHAWQVRARGAENGPAPAASTMRSVLQELHNRAHLDNLPVQQLEDGSSY
jgi:hypothetical protein